MEDGLGLRWKLGSERGGKLRLASSTLNSAELEVLQASPLYWEVEGDGIILEPGDFEVKGQVQQCIKIKATASNRTLETFNDVKVSLIDENLNPFADFYSKKEKKIFFTKNSSYEFCTYKNSKILRS